MHSFARKHLFFFLISLYGAGFAILFAVSWHRSSFFQSNIETFSEPQRTAVLYVFLGLLVVYALIAHVASRMSAFSMRKAMLLAAPFVLLLVSTPPLLSTDTAVYVANARNFVQFHISPYDNSAINASWPDEIGTIRWLQSGSSYGPLFHIMTIPFGGLFFASASVAVFAYKLSLLVLFIASVWLMDKLLKHLYAPPHFLVLYALNPALLINGIMEGHNDMLVLFSLLALFYFLKDTRHIRSIAVFGASVALKYLTVILLPIFWIRHRTLKWGQLGSAMLVTAFMLYAGATVFGLPLSDIVRKLEMRQTLPCLFHCSPYVAFTNAISGPHAQTVRLISFVIAYFWFLYYFLMKKYDPLKFAFWSLTALIFIYASWMSPWYLIILFPLALLHAQDRLYAMAFWTLTLYSLLSYF